MTHAETHRLILASGMTLHLGLPHFAVMEQLGRLIAAAKAEEAMACAELCRVKEREWLARNPRQQHSHGAGIGASVCASEIDLRAREHKLQCSNNIFDHKAT